MSTQGMDLEEDLDIFSDFNESILMSGCEFNTTSIFYPQFKHRESSYPSFHNLPSIRSEESGVISLTPRSEVINLCSNTQNAETLNRTSSENINSLRNQSVSNSVGESIDSAIGFKSDDVQLTSTPLALLQRNMGNQNFRQDTEENEIEDLSNLRNPSLQMTYDTVKSRTSYNENGTNSTSILTNKSLFNHDPVQSWTNNDKNETEVPSILTNSYLYDYDPRHSWTNDENTILSNPSLISQSVLHFYNEECKYLSDFSYIYLLAGKLCQSFMPNNCFLNLKMALLLSVTSFTKNSKSIPLPIVAMGSETATINLLMHQIGNVAKRFVSQTDTFNSNGILIKENMIEASPILMANGGIFFLGDWALLKPKLKSSILSEIENGQVRIDKSSLSCPINCAVWCYTSFYKYNQKDLHTMKIFMEVFGIPILVEDASDEYIDFLLSEKDQEINDDDLNVNDIREFVGNMSQQNIEFTSEANALVTKYFVSARKDQPDSITHRGLIALKQMSESFAKLSFRNEVLPKDVVAAIYMNEDFRRQTGMQFETSPRLSVTDNAHEIDSFFNSFQLWLDEYLKKFE